MSQLYDIPFKVRKELPKKTVGADSGTVAKK
jgi:hypothetical protein